MEGYWPRPQARVRLARAALVPPPSTQASSRTGTAGHCTHGDLLGVGNIAAFCEILHIKGRNFPDVFYLFTSAYDPYER